MSRYQQKFPTARLQRFSWKKPQHAAPVVDYAIQDGLARLPPDFGRGLKLTGMNEKLFEFCKLSYISCCLALIPGRSYRNLRGCDPHQGGQLLPAGDNPDSRQKRLCETRDLGFGGNLHIGLLGGGEGQDSSKPTLETSRALSQSRASSYGEIQAWQRERSSCGDSLVQSQ